MRKAFFVFLLAICVTSLSSCGLPQETESSSKLSSISSLSSGSSTDSKPSEDPVVYRTEIDMPDEDTPLTEYTPEQILKVYMESVRRGDNQRLSQIFSAEQLRKNVKISDAPATIYNIEIKEEDMEDWDLPSPPTGTLTFLLQYTSVGYLFDGNTGEYENTLFIRLSQEDGIWKITLLGTSP